MATTNTYDYNPLASVYIDEALRILGVLEEGASASAGQITDATPTFEMYLKSLTKYGLTIWTIGTQSITTVAGTCTYTPTNKFAKITDAVFRNSDGEDTILINLTREEYWNLADKDQAGQPTQYYYDVGELKGDCTLHLWPCPDSSNAGNNETVELTGQLYIEDITTPGSYEIDIPQEWQETIKYGLATRLAPMFGYPVRERTLLLQEYQLMLKENLDWDTEQESVYLRPKATYGN